MYYNDTLENDEELEASKRKKGKKKEARTKNKSVVSLLPILAVHSEDSIKKRNGYTDYFEIKGVNLQSMHNNEKLNAIIEFSFFLRKYTSDFKMIFLTFPADTTSQIEHLSKKIQQTNDPKIFKTQDEKRNELKLIMADRLHIEFYVQIFGKDEKELEENRLIMLDCSHREFHLMKMPIEKKLQIISKLSNLNSGYLPLEHDPNKDWKAGINKKGYDPDVVGFCQPQGGIAFSERCIRKGDGYETCVHLYEYARHPGSFWGKGVFTQPGVATIVDVHTIGKEELLKALDKGIKEQEDRWQEANKDSEKRTALAEYQSLLKLIDDIVQGDETAKEIHTRLFFYAPTLVELEAKVKSVQLELKTRGFHSQINLNEMKEEWLSLFTSYSEQNLRIKRRGQEIKSFSLAGSYPFDFTQLLDPNGLYVGWGNGKSVVVLDMFRKTKQRLSYDFLFFGMKGAGKSSALKKIAEHSVCVHDNCFVFAVSNEFKRMVEGYGGTSMNLSGSDGRTVNAWQIYATVVNEDTGKIDELASFMAWKDAIRINYRFLSGGAKDPKEEMEFVNLATEFYESLDLNMEKITQYPPERYPTYSGFLNYLIKTYMQDNSHFKESVSEYQAARLDGIILTVKSIIRSYGRIFDHVTSFPDLNQIKLGVFNLESLLKQDKNVFNAQFYTIFNMVWDHAIRIGHREKQAYDHGEKNLDEIEHTTIILDEFHNEVRSGNINVMEGLDRLIREGRKYFVQIGLASQNFDDVLPQNVDSEMDKILTSIFNNCTYKFIMKQTPESTDRIREAFRAQLSDAELEQIPSLEPGETILNITGDGNIHFKFELTQRELQIFDGGA